MRDFYGKKPLLKVIDTIGDISQYISPNPPVPVITPNQPSDAERKEINRLMKKHGVKTAINDPNYPTPYFFRDGQKVKFQ
jgi:hypothetical protein